MAWTWHIRINMCFNFYSIKSFRHVCRTCLTLAYFGKYIWHKGVALALLWDCVKLKKPVTQYSKLWLYACPVLHAHAYLSCSLALTWVDFCPGSGYRFSAFWLRSKCSICSYQLNIWYGPHWGPSILNWFLNLGEDAGACSDFSTGWPGLAVPPGTAHSPSWGEISNNVNSPLSPFNSKLLSHVCLSLPQRDAIIVFPFLPIYNDIVLYYIIVTIIIHREYATVTADFSRNVGSCV